MHSRSIQYTNRSSEKTSTDNSCFQCNLILASEYQCTSRFPSYFIFLCKLQMLLCWWDNDALSKHCCKPFKKITFIPVSRLMPIWPVISAPGCTYWDTNKNIISTWLPRTRGGIGSYLVWFSWDMHVTCKGDKKRAPCTKHNSTIPLGSLHKLLPQFSPSGVLQACKFHESILQWSSTLAPCGCTKGIWSERPTSLWKLQWS